MRRTYLTLSEEDKDYLKTLSKKRTIQAQIVDRAKILLYKSDIKKGMIKRNKQQMRLVYLFLRQEALLLQQLLILL